VVELKVALGSAEFLLFEEGCWGKLFLMSGLNLSLIFVEMNAFRLAVESMLRKNLRTTP